MAYTNIEDQRAAWRDHYYRNKPMYRARAKEQLAKTRQFVRDYLLSHPCVGCGESDIVVLEFDHRDRGKKLFAIAEGVRRGMSVKRIASEIAKCDVRCANCHRRKTWFETRSAGSSPAVSATEEPFLDL